MSDDALNPPFFGENPGEAVPEVDPEDLKTLWQEQQELQERHPGKQRWVGVSLSRFANPAQTFRLSVTANLTASVMKSTSKRCRSLRGVLQ